MKTFKWDGHTHTQFCPHGSRDQTSLMVEKAIASGFTHYSITEHAPFPEEILSVHDKKIYPELNLTENIFFDYIAHAQELKNFYSDQIIISIGLEYEYLPGHESYMKDSFEKYHSHISDSLISLHMLPGKTGLSCIDYTPRHLKSELIDYYGSLEKLHEIYWENIVELIRCDLGPHKPKRLGHINLIEKFSRIYELTSMEKKVTEKRLRENIFPLLLDLGYSLDFNISGLHKKYCQQMYLSDFMIKLCHDMNIPVVYGSDSHGIDHVAYAYEKFSAIVSRASLNLLPPPE